MEGSKSDTPKPIGDLVLVSGSPRRKALLAQLGLVFTVISPDVDETVDRRVRPTAYVRTVARRKLLVYIGRKAGSPAANPSANPSASAGVGAVDPAGPTAQWALAADTIVVHRNRIIGKPNDRKDAELILRLLSGHEHSVITALALYNPHSGAIAVETETTKVTFSRLTEEELHWYLSCGEWEGVAGGYRIQERGSVLIRRIVGSYSNVVGLPIELFYGMVHAQGYTLFPTGNENIR